MLDKPVPNPMAKNPNFNTHKVLATLGIILFSTIIVVFTSLIITGLDIADLFANKAIDSTKISTASAQSKTSTDSAKKDETQGWKEFSNPGAGFSVKYPSGWFIRGFNNGENCNVDHTFIAPTETALGVCASGVGGLISITRTTSGANLASVFPNYDSHNFTNRQDSQLKIDGKNARRISGTSNLVSETDNFTGHKFIVYLVDLGDRTLIIQYNQSPSSSDYSKEFEQIVETLKFL